MKSNEAIDEMYSSKDTSLFTTNLLNLPLPSSFNLRHILPSQSSPILHKISTPTKFIYSNQCDFQNVLSSTDDARGVAFIDHPVTSSTRTTAKRKCSGKTAKKIPRPRNSFMIYRQNQRTKVVAMNPGINDSQVSVILGEMWRKEEESVKAFYRDLANEEKHMHALKYPDYKYQPKRKPKKSKVNLPDDSKESNGRRTKDFEKSSEINREKASLKQKGSEIFDIIESSFSSMRPVEAQRAMFGYCEHTHPYSLTPEMIIIPDEEDTTEILTENYCDSTSATPELPYSQQEIRSLTPELLDPCFEFNNPYSYQTQSASHLYTSSLHKEYSHSPQMQAVFARVEPTRLTYPHLHHGFSNEVEVGFTPMIDPEQYISTPQLWSHLPSTTTTTTPLSEFQSNLYQLEQSLLQLLEPSVYEEPYIPYEYAHGSPYDYQ